MSTRYKSSAELTNKYVKDGVNLTKAQRDAWISLRTKEILKEDPLSDEEMARFDAAADFDKTIPSAVNNARLAREGLDRTREQIADALEASRALRRNPPHTHHLPPPLSPTVWGKGWDRWDTTQLI